MSPRFFRVQGSGLSPRFFALVCVVLTLVVRGVRLRTLVAGDFHGCALDGTGAAFCWGDAYYGATAAPGASTTFSTLAAGAMHTCGVLGAPGGGLLCWGNNVEGACSPAVGAAALTVSAGAYHTCFLRVSDSEAACFGTGSLGQTAPPASGGAGGYLDISCRLEFCCALRAIDSSVV